MQAEGRKFVTFCWVPVHVGVAGNDEADRTPSVTSASQDEYIEVEYRDWCPLIRAKFLKTWSNESRTKKW